MLSRLEETTPLKNWIVDHLMGTISPGEFVVLVYIIRRTVGFHKKFDSISIDQFANGIKRSDGSKLDEGTGLSESSVKRNLRSLVSRGLVLRSQRSELNGNILPSTFEFSAEGFHRLAEGGQTYPQGGPGWTAEGGQIGPSGGSKLTPTKESKKKERKKEERAQERAGFIPDEKPGGDPYAEMHGDKWLERVAQDHRVPIGQLKREQRAQLREKLNPDLDDIADRHELAEASLIEARDKAMFSPLGYVLSRLRGELSAPRPPWKPSAGGNSQGSPSKPRRETGEEAQARITAAFLAKED